MKFSNKVLRICSPLKIEKQIFKQIILLLIILISSARILAQSQSDSRKIQRSYPAQKSTTVDISNKYGKVNVVTWDADSIVFNIEIKASSSDVNKLLQLMQSVDFKFSTTGNYIIAETIITSSKSGFFGDIKKMTEELVTSESAVQIDYMVKVPSYINLKINNKYGDISVEDLKGNLELILSNGKFKLAKLGNTVMDIKFGNGTIKSANTAKLTMLYSEIQFDYVTQLEVESKYSAYRIEDVNVLKIKSKRDKFYIGSCKYLYGDTYFSILDLKKMNKELSLDLKYGELIIEKIASDFSFVNLNSKFTDISIGFASTASYSYEFSLTDVTLNFAKAAGNSTITPSRTEADVVIHTGKIGKTSTSSLKIIAQENNLTINQD